MVMRRSWAFRVFFLLAAVQIAGSRIACADAIGRITTGGAITLFSVSQDSGPAGITPGSDGNLWFTENTGDRVGRMTTAGSVTEFTVPTQSAGPLGITA